MLHAKFQDHRTSSFGEDFLKVFTKDGHCGHLGHVTMTIFTKFMLPLPMEAPHKNLALIGRVVSEKKMFENYVHIHVYSPSAGARQAQRINFFHKI